MKKALSMMAALSMVLGLAACGGTAPASSAPASSAPASSAPASSEAPASSAPAAEGGDATQMSAEITWWAFPTFAMVDDTSGKYEQSVIDAFNQKYPNIKVNLEMIDFQTGPEKVTTAIQGGTAPDIIFDAPGRIIEWGRAGNLAPLDDLFTEDFKTDVGNPGLIDSCSDGKTFWMYPISAAAFDMAINMTAIEEAGLTDMAPKAEGSRTWTTEQFVALSKAMAEKGYKGAEIYVGGQGGDQGTRAFITNLTGASIMDAGRTKYTMDTPEGIQAVQMVLDGIKEGWLLSNPGVASDTLDNFDQGLTWASILWSPGVTKQRAENLAAAGITAMECSLPSPTGTPVFEYLVNGFCVFNNGDDNKIAASKEFLKFICDDPVIGKQNVVQTGSFPVRQSFGNLYEGDVTMAYYASLNQYFGPYYNTVPGFGNMRAHWWGSLQAATTGEKTAEEAMKYYTEESNKTLAG